MAFRTPFSSFDWSPAKCAGFLLLVALGCINAGAQTAAVNYSAGIDNSPLDIEWVALRDSVRSIGKSNWSTGSNTAPLSREAQTANLITLADKLKDFYTKSPSFGAVSEARQLETLCLNWAASNGDTAHDARRLALLEEVRRDQELAPVKRYEAVAWAGQAMISRQKPSNHAAFLLAQEAVSRGLITEFPGVNDGYESLLAIGKDSAPERSRAIAVELSQKQVGPRRVKDEAQRLLKRLDMIGKELGPILIGSSAGIAVRQNTNIIIYTWSKNSQHSMQSVRSLVFRAKGAQFIGVCLDSEVPAAKESAKAAGLPGDVYYSVDGSKSSLATALAADQPSLVYLLDKQGVIRDVQGLSDSAVKLANIGF